MAEAEQAIGRPLPPDLAALYQLSDGQADWAGVPAGEAPRLLGRWLGPLFGAGWTFNPLARLRTEYRGWARLSDQYWIPFATDGDGNSLAADLAPEPGGRVGQVIVIGPDEDLRRVLAPSVPALLRLCAARLSDPGLLPEVAHGIAFYPLERSGAAEASHDTGQM